MLENLPFFWKRRFPTVFPHERINRESGDAVEAVGLGVLHEADVLHDVGEAGVVDDGQPSCGGGEFLHELVDGVAEMLGGD